MLDVETAMGAALGERPLRGYTKTYILVDAQAKPLYWLGSSLGDLRAFPEDARRSAGHQLRRVEQGLEPHDWKPMSSVGAGVYEIRIHAASEYRVLYVSKFTEGMYVLHAFEKGTRQTRQADIQLAKKRFSDLKRLRQER